MAAVLPNYEVEFIPLERRLNDRRTNPNAGLPQGVLMDRRLKSGRRQDDQPQKNLTDMACCRPGS